MNSSKKEITCKIWNSLNENLLIVLNSVDELYKEAEDKEEREKGIWYKKEADKFLSSAFAYNFEAFI